MPDIAQAFRDELLNQNVSDAASEVADRATFALAQSLQQAARASAELASQFKGGFSIAAERQMFSLGGLCRLFGLAPDAVRGICHERKIEPDFMFDDVPFFAGPAVIAISDVLREGMKAKQQ